MDLELKEYLALILAILFEFVIVVLVFSGQGAQPSLSSFITMAIGGSILAVLVLLLVDFFLKEKIFFLEEPVFKLFIVGFILPILYNVIIQPAMSGWDFTALMHIYPLALFDSVFVAVVAIGIYALLEEWK